MKPTSQEQLLNRLLLAGNGIITLLLGYCVWLTFQSSVLVFAVIAILFPIQVVLSLKIITSLFKPFYQTQLMLDAIKNDDFAIDIHVPFSQGVSAYLLKELKELALSLRKKKRLYDEKNLLFYTLIQQLDSPVILLDANARLQHGNKALTHWLNKDWHLYRLMHAKHLKLNKSPLGWKFTEESLHQHYQIRSASYKDESGLHELLVFNDIHKELRNVQTQSWSQMVRVLSHEINNSLVPIQSLAQTLEQCSDNEQDKKVLAVISQRSKNLNSFVKQYSKVVKTFDVHKVNIDVSSFISPIIKLFDNVTCKLLIDVHSITADPVLLEQVLINLIENARQASLNKCEITLKCFKTTSKYVIQITDNGSGIQNPDNLFIPFYTTKENGQGVGLCLCRNIIEQQGGNLTLVNRRDGICGAEANLTLPIV